MIYNVIYPGSCKLFGFNFNCIHFWIRFWISESRPLRIYKWDGAGAVQVWKLEAFISWRRND